MYAKLSTFRNILLALVLRKVFTAFFKLYVESYSTKLNQVKVLGFFGRAKQFPPHKSVVFVENLTFLSMVGTKLLLGVSFP